MPLVLLSLHIYFYQTTSYSQSAAGSFHGSLEKKTNSVNICPIELQIQSEKGHTDLIFPVCNEQWWSRHQNSRISSFYFFSGPAGRDIYSFWPGNTGSVALPFLLRLRSDLVYAWMNGWLASVCASRGFCCSDDLIAVCPPPVLSQQKALL